MVLSYTIPDVLFTLDPPLGKSKSFTGTFRCRPLSTLIISARMEYYWSEPTMEFPPGSLWITVANPNIHDDRVPLTMYADDKDDRRAVYLPIGAQVMVIGLERTLEPISRPKWSDSRGVRVLTPQGMGVIFEEWWQNHERQPPLLKRIA